MIPSMSIPTLRRVVIVQRYVLHYRVPFLNQLREKLASSGVELVVVHGLKPKAAAENQGDTTDLTWSVLVKNRWISFPGMSLLWQPAMRYLRGADLVIVEQATSYLLNYRLFARQLRRRTNLAFWGHGRNMKAHRASRVGEAIKRFMSSKVHWWFAYNALSSEIVRELGFPPERITDVQNAVDTRALRRAWEALTPADTAALRAELGLPESNVGVFVGGMYPEKHLGFLIQAAVHVRRLVPDFHLILIGAGSDERIAADAADRYEWVHYLGPLMDQAKVPYMAAADLFLLPGLVGLAIVDSFALELPLVTTADAAHSPEIDYLESGRNGIMCPSGATPEDFAQEVARLLQDDAARKELVEGCRRAAACYTIEEMVERFSDGVLAALAAPQRS